jgi:hypothetical protein
LILTSITRICVVLAMLGSLLLPAFAQLQSGQGQGQLPALNSTSANQIYSDYIPDSLFIGLLSDGNALVEYDVNITNPEAPATNVTLFGNTFNDLLVVDYSDKLVAFDMGKNPNQISLDTFNVTSARINYETPDLVNKQGKIWTFSINSTIEFSVKLPPSSVVIDWGDRFPAFLRHIGDQDVVTFDPGSVRISYVIGFVGTEDQANAAIKSADFTIRDTQSRYQGIVLSEAQALLQQANAAKSAGRFADAERMATQANDAAVNTAKNYTAAQTAIAAANDQIKKASDQGINTDSARALLQQANAEFSDGRYANALELAQNAQSAIGTSSGSGNMTFIFMAVAAAVAAAGGIAALVLLRRRKHSTVTTAGAGTGTARPRLGYGGQAASDNIVRAGQDPDLRPDLQLKPAGDSSSRDLGGPVLPSHSAPPYSANADLLPKTGTGTGTGTDSKPPSPATSPASTGPSSIFPDSQTDKDMLSKIVAKMIQERPNLRPEDQQALGFLAENEGAAFESELRNKFQLPKTTIWRLVKRLEREELVEIRKAGGQNLIKLRFEGRSP